MLLLTRNIGKSLEIGTDITVTVTKIELDGRGNPIVELGIDAPKHINIDRTEVRERRVANIEKRIGK